MDEFRPYRVFCESKNLETTKKLARAIQGFYTGDYSASAPTFIIHEIEKESVDLNIEGDRKAMFYNPDLNESLAGLAEAYARRHPMVLTLHVGFLEDINLPYNLRNVQPSTVDKLASDIMLVSGDFIFELNKKIMEKFVQ